MGRPRKGVVQRPDGHWTVSLPLAVGSKQTRQFTDPDEAAVRRWYADGERTLAAGQPLPDPDSYRTNRPAPALTARTLGDRTPAHWWAGPTAAFGHRFDKVAEAFLVHRYDRQRAGQPERRGAVVTVIDNDLKPFFAQHQVPVIEGITHELVGKLAAHLAVLDAADEPQPEPWPELNGRTEITFTEAAALPGTSRSTVKRWHTGGLLPSWHCDQLDGQVRIRVDELRAAHRSARGPPPRAWATRPTPPATSSTC